MILLVLDVRLTPLPSIRDFSLIVFSAVLCFTLSPSASLRWVLFLPFFLSNASSSRSPHQYINAALDTVGASNERRAVDQTNEATLKRGGRLYRQLPIQIAINSRGHMTRRRAHEQRTVGQAHGTTLLSGGRRTEKRGEKKSVVWEATSYAQSRFSFLVSRWSLFWNLGSGNRLLVIVRGGKNCSGAR